jgi:PAS domain S-box-containing protein
LRSENRDLKAQVKALQEELEEKTRTLEAIQGGEVDAIVISTSEGEKVFTLKGAEEPYRILFEQMNEGAVTISQDGEILYSNHSFADSMKTSLEKVIGTNIERFIHPSRRPSFHRILDTSVEGPERDDVRFEAMDGSAVPMQLSVNYLPSEDNATYCIVMADLTERILAEDALRRANEDLETKVRARTKDLRESEERFRLALRNAPVSVAVQDRDLKYIWAYNQKIARPDEMIGKTDAEIFSPREVQRINEIKGRVLDEDKEIREQMWLDQPNGKIFTEITFAPIHDIDGNVIGVGSATVDLTKMKLAEDELRRSNADLQQFAYVASHDLQEPLRMTISYLSLLERRFSRQMDHEAIEYIGHAIQGGTRMRELIDDLLEYSRVDSVRLPFTDVDMNRVVERTIELLKVPIEENGAEIETDRLPNVTADESQMVQVMQNLVSNAIKFQDKDRPRVNIEARSEPAEWVFSVRDNGIGLNMEYSDKIFQVFKKLHNKDQYAGTGVGLAIVRKIVERHEGRVWVESEEGHGATFYFTIPKVKRES